MAAKHTNENYIHDCGTEKIELSLYKKSIIEMGFNNEEIIQILDFYLFHAPISKNDSDPFTIKSLKDYGWHGNADMIKLEGRLLNAANITNFCFIKANAINETLESMNLTDKICIEHPRAVLKQNYIAHVYENGTVEIKQKETRLECLFRHIRNSLAHNQTYHFDNDNILIEDSDDNKVVTARILIPKRALLNWIRITSKEEN